jgi:hypothetical protein
MPQAQLRGASLQYQLDMIHRLGHGGDAQVVLGIGQRIDVADKCDPGRVVDWLNDAILTRHLTLGGKAQDRDR